MNLDQFYGHLSKKTLFVGFLCLIMLFSLTKVSFAHQRLEFKLNVLGGIPVGEFGNHVGRMAWGGSLFVAYHLRETPFLLGADLALSQYGQESRTEILGGLSGFSDDEKYSYNIFSSHLVFRYEPLTSRVIPYLEGLIGFNTFFTQSNTDSGESYVMMINDTVFFFDDDETKTHLSDLALSYGLSGGVKIRVGQTGSKRNSKSYPKTFYLDIQLRYLFGGKAKYLKKGSLEIINDQLIYDIHRSHTDLFFFSVGFSLRDQ